MNPRLVVLAALAALCACDGSTASDSCAPDDADGVVGVPQTIELTVDDGAFAPPNIKIQNRSPITLTLRNGGTKPHGLAIDCLPTPNARGCPTEECFPSTAMVAPLAPGGATTISFQSPAVEGNYTFRSPVAGDAMTGQLVLQ